MNPKKIFETGLQYHHYANTAYPLTPNSFKSFRIKDHNSYRSFLIQDWSKAEALSLYVHVPFCKLRCRFCEYVVLEDCDAETEELYVDLLLKEIEMYASILKGKTIVGYDLGGGTPAKLSIENIKRITEALEAAFSFQDGVIYSIETTPVIAANEPEKLVKIRAEGYERISMGIQTVSEHLLNELGREGTTHIYERAVANIRKAGFKRLNIDLMYGFLYQNDEDFENTLEYAMGLDPEFITLYRNRYKGTKLEQEAGGVSLYKIMNQYRLAYDMLTKKGYEANYGKNTFSKVRGDYGTSDYLTKRVIEGVPYVGLGLGAQSFGNNYLAYNDGAATKRLSKYQEKIENGQLPIQDIYDLDMEESIAKMVSVAFYFGFVDLGAFKKRFGVSFTEHFKEEVNFVVNEGLMEFAEDRLMLTNRGSDYINGIIPLFYSNRSKQELIELHAKSKTISSGEAEFLKAYNIEEYERPSVATDIVVLSKERDNISVVLIRRGEHPYMNDWALPGGFVRPDESIESAALRELREETNINNIALSQLQVFSEPKRDPRGWIISCSLYGIADPEDLALRFGEDAIDARTFKVKLFRKSTGEGNETIHLELADQDLSLKAQVLKEMQEGKYGGQSTYSIVESNGIAFDHAKIIILALERSGLA